MNLVFKALSDPTRRQNPAFAAEKAHDRRRLASIFSLAKPTLSAISPSCAKPT